MILNQARPIFGTYKKEILVFIIAITYIFFLTAGIPLFWEEQVYQTEYIQQPFVHWFKEILFGFGKNNLFQTSRPFDALLFKVLFSIAGYNYIAMRFAKAVLFSIFICLIFFFVKKYMKNSIVAYAVSFFIMCSLSLYIHTLVFAEPYLLTEVLKLNIFLLFLSDYFSEKTSFSVQFLIALLFLLSVRAYNPAYSTMGILFLFIIFYNWKKSLRYAGLFVFFLITAIPWPFKIQIGEGSSAFAPKLWSIQHFFLADISSYVSTPIISLQGLYYKPFFALLSFFGVWLVITFFLIFLFRHFFIKYFSQYFIYKETTKSNLLDNVNSKMLAIFLSVWLFAELPLWIILPEHATRYATSVLLPFSLLIVLMILHCLAIVKQNYRFFFSIFVISLLILSILTNLAYVIAFRAGWGSSFIAIEKTQDFIADNKEGSAIVLYYGQSVAEEYYPINKSSKGHEFVGDLTFKQIRDVSDLEEKDILLYTKEYQEVYILKRVTSGITSLPDINFTVYPSLEPVQIIEGTKFYDPFDIMIKFMANKGIFNYNPNYVYIYKIRETYHQ